jgi:hypothetical protein
MSIFGASLSDTFGSWDTKPVLPYVKTLEISDNFTVNSSGGYTTNSSELFGEVATDRIVAARYVIHPDTDPLRNDDPINYDIQLDFDLFENSARFRIWSYQGLPGAVFVHATMYLVFLPTE